VFDHLQQVYEAILGRRLNRAHSRTELVRIELLEHVGVQTDAGGSQGGRPPTLYRSRFADVEAEDLGLL